MSNQLHNELKKEFQLERMILFSDAVFAIAITLLVLEIKIPDVHEDVSDKRILIALGHLFPKFLGFFISFLLIALYWVLHHRLFGFVTSYDKKLLILNLVFLFFVVFMPFSTGLYSEYAGPELVRQQLKIPFTFYVLNFCCLGFTHHFMWRYVTNPAHKLTEPPIDPLTVRLTKFRSLLVPSVFLLMLPVAYLTNILIAIYMPMLIPILLKITNRRINRSHKKNLNVN